MFSEVPQIARDWWVLALLGLICVVTGIVAIVWPGITLLALGLIFGIYLVIAASMEIVDAITGPPGGRAISAILGAIALIAGLICIRRPGASLLAIVIAVGIYLVASGVIRIVLSFETSEGRGWAIALGALDTVIGILILAWPGLGLATLALLFAVSMLIRGIFAIVIGFKLRGMRHGEPPPVHTANLAT
ncbi:HdeD family acid-resistance protein [Candidatus Solirubrobacter pratensis]|uniref:HdeD family acid-resistance protein n=1 Tax=Candidatus Solirubrobacter pratensis TaxID=1298857 RepID=UPI00040D1E3D|nr:DUF308 domain-containing protein [Candidatus Solirubrobacter pratensis]